MPTKPAHSPTPWKVAPGLHGEAHICLEDGTVVLQSTTRGGLPASSNALHAAACVNGTDARTVALKEALQLFMDATDYTAKFGPRVNEQLGAVLPSMIIERARAALALL